MDCVVEILLKNTDPGTVERKVGQVMDLAADGFKARERVAFYASPDAFGTLAGMDGGTAKVRVCKISE